MLVSEFFTLTGIAVLVAWPFSYLVMENWLQNYPLRTEMTFAPFMLGGIAAFAITLFTVSYHSVRAAYKDPVHDLAA